MNWFTLSAAAQRYNGSAECEQRPEPMEVMMWYRFSIFATAALMLSGLAAAAAELPTYEIMGFPITQHQIAAVNSALVQERAPNPTLTMGGMPASPVQIAVLTPRPKQEIASKEGR